VDPTDAQKESQRLSTRRDRVGDVSVRHLQVFYTIACTIWTIYLIQLAIPRPSHPEATVAGAVYCVLFLAVLPSIAGYALLFKAGPLVGRSLRR
jgi:hypothetical protein